MITPISSGIITDRNTEQLQKTFEYAISKANTALGIPLVAYKEEISSGDSIDGYTRLCKFMQVINVFIYLSLIDISFLVSKKVLSGALFI